MPGPGRVPGSTQGDIYAEAGQEAGAGEGDHKEYEPDRYSSSRGRDADIALHRLMWPSVLLQRPAPVPTSRYGWSLHPTVKRSAPRRGASSFPYHPH
jgi:hypothetical protein